jgi:hypothetical protein
MPSLRMDAMTDAKERSRLPEGMSLEQLTPTPNQSYNVLLNGTFVGTSEHQAAWHGAHFWLFTNIEGVQRWVGEGHHHQAGAAWLKEADQPDKGVPPAHSGTDAGYDPNDKRRRAVENHAVKKLMDSFAAADYIVEDVGNRHVGYDIRVVSIADSREWHVEAKGTRGACGTVQITEGERRHNQTSCDAEADVLGVVSGIEAHLVGTDFECSEGIVEWVWPWSISQMVTWETGLQPDRYRYTVPEGRYSGPVPPPASA